MRSKNVHRRSILITSLLEDATPASSLWSKGGSGSVLSSGGEKETKEADMNATLYAKRDPEEEFFMLSVLAIKLNHTEMYEDTDHIYKYAPDELFQ